MQLLNTSLRQRVQRSRALNCYVVARRVSTNHDTQLSRRNVGKVPSINSLVERIIGLTRS